MGKFCLVISFMLPYLVLFSNTTFTVAQLKQLFLDQVIFQPIKCIRLFDLPIRMQHSITWFNLSWLLLHLRTWTMMHRFFGMEDNNKMIPYLSLLRRTDGESTRGSLKS